MKFLDIDIQMNTESVLLRRQWKKFGQAVNDQGTMSYIDREVFIESPNADPYNKVIFDGTNWMFSGILSDRSEEIIRSLYPEIKDLKHGNDTDNCNVTVVQSGITFASKFIGNNTEHLDEKKLKDERTVYIRGFNQESTEAEIQNVIYNLLYGSNTSNRNPYFKIKMINDNRSNNFRGIVFLTLSNPKEAQRAVSLLNGYKLESLILYCKSAVNVTKQDMHN